MGAGCSERAGNPHKATIAQGIARFAGHQLQLVTARQLTGVGLARSSIRDRLRSGRLHRLHQGVYATHPPRFSLHQRYLAAVLACGPGALLSDLAAANLQGFASAPPLQAQVTVAGQRGRSRHGIEAHSRAPVDSRDIRRFDSVPCVSADLVLIQLAPSHALGELEALLVAAESKGLIKRGRLGELVAEHRGRPGIHRLASLLALEPQLARSDLELLFLPVWRAAGVDRPRVNFPIAVPGRERPLRVDFAWPEIRMVVEADSQRFHGDWERAEIDRERDQLLALAGWVSHRFVRRRIANNPAASAERLRLLAAVRTAELG